MSLQLGLTALLIAVFLCAFNAPVFMRISEVGPWATAFWRLFFAFPIVYAAEQRHAKAQHELSLIYHMGKGIDLRAPGIPRDHHKAVHWYRKAAEQGLAEAQYNLGQMYRNGEGVPEDDGIAKAIVIAFPQSVSWLQTWSTRNLQGGTS